MKNYLKVEGHPGLVRDPESGAILNINTSELEQRSKVRSAKRKERERVDKLESEISEIKYLLQQLLEKS